MADNTGIEWTDATWNPITGCTKVSPGCDHCYAETFAERWRGTPGHYFENGFDVQLRPDKLVLPLSWRKPRKVFVNSMSDLFHKDIPDEYIAQVFVMMALTSQHTYQLLTKRHGRMRSLLSAGDRWHELLTEALIWAAHIDLPIPLERFTQARQWIYGSGNWTEPVAPLPNVWLGVSVEDQMRADLRIPALLATPAAVRFLSCEPLLGPVDLTNVDWDGATGLCVLEKPFSSIDWVIVGGESGIGHRPLDLGWVRSLRDQCEHAGVPFLFKQVGGRTAKSGGRELDGRTWDEYPTSPLASGTTAGAA